MLRLVKNDFVANGVTLFGLFVLLNASLVASFTTQVFHRESCIVLTGLIAMVSPLPILLRSEVYKSVVLYRSLPIHPFQIAGAKYLSVVCAFGAIILYALVYLLIMDSGNHPTHLFQTLYRVRFSLLVELMYFAGIFVMGIPLIIRFGSFMRMMWGVVFFMVLHNYVYRFLRRSAVWVVNTAGFGEAIFVLVALILILGTLSALVSTRLLRVREI